MNFLSDKSYLAVKPQAAAGTPIIPDFFIPLISESIRINPNYTADRRMKGIDWKSDELLKGPRAIEGDISIYGDPDSVAHLLNMTYAKGATTGDASNGYTHPFTVGEGKHYTLEISRGDFAQRIWGVRGETLKLEFQDNKLVGNLTIKALGQFYTVSLGANLNGSVTSLVLATDYDLRPSDGLKVGDVLRIVENDGSTVDVTITSVNADGKTIGFASTAIIANSGQAVFLLAQTPSYPASREPLYFGNALVGIGANETAATSAAGSKSTATPCYAFTPTFKNNLLGSPASGSTGPSALLNQVREAAIELSRLFEDPTQYQKWLETKGQAITAIVTGRFIDTGLTVSEKLTVKFYKTKLMTNEEPLEVGGYIFDRQTLESLYDSSAGKAVEVSLINRVSGEDLGDPES